MGPQKRIGLGGVWHETNSFVPGFTQIEDFERYQLARGASLVEAYEGTGTEMGGAIGAARRSGSEIVPLTFAAAVPSGLVSRAAFERIKGWIMQDLRSAARFDALLLVLHGALVVEGSLYPEAELVENIRRTVGQVPLAVTVDLHANIGQRLVGLVDVLVGYDTFPHVDMANRGAEAHDLLLRILNSGQRPVAHHTKVPFLTVPQMQGTAEEPMRSVMADVFKAEEQDGVWTVSAIPGYPYSDIDRLGFSIYAAADPGAGDVTERIAARVWEHRRDFEPKLLDADQAISRAASSEGPVVLADVADNVGGGSPGDGTILLDALERHAKRDAVVVIWDPVAVARLYESPTDHGAIEVGSRSGLGPAVQLEGAIRLPGHVVYRRAGPYMTGQAVDMGRVAVVASRAGDVVITERRVMPFDDDHLRSLGLKPETYHVIVAKSAFAWRAAFGAYARSALYVRTPGFCPSELGALGLSGPAASYYPLRRDATWSPSARE